MTTDFRALCAELADELTQFNAWYIEDNGYGLPALEALLRRSDAALAQSDEPAVPEGSEPASVVSEPSDEEIMELWHGSDWYNEGATLREFLSITRAVLARWGNSAPLAEGEVAELVKWLRMQGEAQKPGLNSLLCKKTKKELQTNGERLIRAADLLQQQAPVPVSVSERLPGPEDCDAEGRCWVWWKNGVRWVLDEWTHHELREGLLSDYVSYWLPAHAIPIPTAND